MIRVSNRKCIRNLSRKSLRASRTRNIIAVLAIALTALLFTALFTIAMSINTSFQEANFRQVGAFAHGGFKYLTKEQFEELREDPLISEWGYRRFLGMPGDIPFNKNHVEIGYSSEKDAHWMYCDPIKGRLPQEGTNEAATDLEVLSLLGVEPELGAEFTITFSVDGVETTRTFTLCGWWEKDEITVANHVLIPESRVDEVLQELQIPFPARDGMTGSWNMDVMFKNASNIEGNLNQILANHGYQSEGKTFDEPYIATGVNWGYTGAQLSDSVDPMTVIAIVSMLLLIIFTGYLIIYNVFRISVVGDIRFYGMLKTIGTTGRQIRRIIRQQALFLSLGGIPLGLVLGWLLGAKLTPVILGTLNDVMVDVVSVDPWIFVISTLFALATVLLSCSKPGRMAARISPVEAVRYIEGSTSGKMPARKASKSFSLFHMARANMGRSKSKTVVTIVSLSLSVVLLNATVMFTNGFDMDKYLADKSVADFIVAGAEYFQSHGIFLEETAVTGEIIDTVMARGGITDGGRVYGKTTMIEEFVTEDYFRQNYGRYVGEDQIEEMLSGSERNAEGKVADRVQLSGMESFPLDCLKVLEGDITKLYEPGGRYVAAVYWADDYGNPQWDSHWAKLGDKVTLRYVEECEYYNPVTGEIYGEDEEIGDRPFVTRSTKYTDLEYEVAALVEVPHALSYRYYGADEFVMNDQTFMQDTGTSNVMLYAFDTTEEANPQMEQFLQNYTENENPAYDYESKTTYQAQFDNFRNMFLLMGSVLSFVIGLIGILNYFNAILTGIITRRREFAMLQSIGMTGKQLKRMLVYEGLFYALGSVACALILSLATGPLVASALGSMFWFFTYHPTIAPVLLLAPVFAFLGCAVPLLVYRSVSKQTIVERLREAEN